VDGQWIWWVSHHQASNIRSYLLQRILFTSELKLRTEERVNELPLLGVSYPFLVLSQSMYSAILFWRTSPSSPLRSSIMKKLSLYKEYLRKTSYELSHSLSKEVFVFRIRLAIQALYIWKINVHRPFPYPLGLPFLRP